MAENIKMMGKLSIYSIFIMPIKRYVLWIIYGLRRIDSEIHNDGASPAPGCAWF